MPDVELALSLALVLVSVLLSLELAVVSAGSESPVVAAAVFAAVVAASLLVSVDADTPATIKTSRRPSRKAGRAVSPPREILMASLIFLDTREKAEIRTVLFGLYFDPPPIHGVFPKSRMTRIEKDSRGNRDLDDRRNAISSV